MPSRAPRHRRNPWWDRLDAVDSPSQEVHVQATPSFLRDRRVPAECGPVSHPAAPWPPMLIRVPSQSETTVMTRMNGRSFIACLLLAALMVGCARNDATRDQSRAESRASSEIAIQRPTVSGFDRSSTSILATGSRMQRGHAANELVGTEEVSEDESQEFSGSPCMDNCSGHEAGYEWAEQHGVADPNECGGDSNSFFEGCMAYAQEQRQDRDTHDE